MKGRILVVDDERDMLALLTRIITEKSPHDVTTEHDPLKAVEIIQKETFNLIITDLKMPKMDGIALLEEIKKIQPSSSVIIMTAYATIETAVEATRKGAFDYISKPFRKERILLTIRRALEWQALSRENVALRQSLEQQKAFPPIIGSSPAMMSILNKVKQVAKSMATILIQGKSGTGKELVAKAIHAYSDRRDKPFVTIDCTAIPEQIIESELFGHEKGAFTGAWKDKQGLVDKANQGTLFLDEIGELSLVMQAKLLRLLQEGEYKPVGSVNTKHADIRFVAATNHDLRQRVAEKKFREDLFYRLNVICFHLPALCERREDIPLLVRHFLEKYSHSNRKEIHDIEPEAMSMLMGRQWPGNVRELENVIERGVILCRSERIRPEDLMPERAYTRPLPHLDETIYRLPFKEAKEAVIKAFHHQYIRAILQQNRGNISRAAEQAGLQRQYLHRLMKDENIRAESFKDDTYNHLTVT
ncbi:MAG: sigma-54-dependent Fis family transcriptional regulator [Deltaproteobacteria bacterium]|nr:sigma-54-dependent Fis family transcriptional regulator [Deltaproteobacteria bacterium]MBW2019084.1 sigma-54-dependent Fis family transcriptional regulator [Deltaproteobacteria bacterium]MBW2073525.1 sigma-54-dependent Fis family transcriptional regulator [Deltaproteobacteria bacterium]